ncbi:MULTISPECIES: ABC transporter ATP-binding protein [unclassified Chelatococcus]|uniref:ABC transporter ATP-binding protein n=1 Tax=unclassified Chelatococcus TaxID=2638111 RepID=UPI001BD1837F|nr:ABC transporter ATP-binding protein [Chelatococcus sp.]MBS7696432.1 ABC transporter ATP-binding protein [Chelatococcus sp. YT9]MBX3557042.1 ABC transporter ATP-binding protein [Chelatococcus sp.]
MTDAKAVLEIRNLRGGYGEVDILNGIDLVLREKEILTVAGTNGAGKSTLAKAVVGLLPRVNGEISVDGQDILAVPAYRRMAHGIGYVPQVSNVFAALSITENLQVVAGVADRKQRIEEMFTLFPLLGERRRARAGSLSGGERQQLAFARALMSRPSLMVLDEPTAALAPAKVAEAFALIARLPSLGVSTLIVEQRARQSLAISDRGCILDGGKVALEGAADALLADPRAAELYLGQG